ncbi:alpha/beta fold hydrolase [Paenibacillus sp. FSL H8-0048]|uniref:alpha/beta hydrolase family protein n=1 Tax=Paenibacillus sp. FSL H8-0048 TaxID=2954508 RepID=UPI0030F7113C
MTNQERKQSEGKLAGQAVAENESIFRHSVGMVNKFVSHMDFHFTRTLAKEAYGGVSTGECFEAASHIVDGDFSTYAPAWQPVAERMEAKGWDCLKKGHKVSAREAFMRAAVYWGCVGMYTSDSDPLTRESCMRTRALWKEAGKLSDPIMEPVDIPYENGKVMKGYFIAGGASGEKRPTLLGMGGGENYLEEIYFQCAGAVRRGYNLLIFEVPGQKAAIWENPDLFIRMDAEVPVGYVVDYALTRPEVDPDRIALIGHSFGGYYVMRAACFERRIAACIASPVIWSMQPEILQILGFDASKPYPRDMESQIDPANTTAQFVLEGDFRARCGHKNTTIAEWMDYLGQGSLLGLEEQITCPVLNMIGEGEFGPEQLEEERKHFAMLKNPKNRFNLTMAYEGGEQHCTENNLLLKNQLEMDWLDEVLGYAGQ